VNAAQALRRIDATLRKQLATEYAVEVEPILDALRLDPDTDDAVWETIASGDFLIGFEWTGPGITPMSNTFNSMIGLMDLGGPTMFLSQPNDPTIAEPMVALAEAPREDRVAQFQATADLMIVSRRRMDRPIGNWDPPGVISVAPDFPREILHACFVAMLEEFSSDRDGVIAILRGQGRLDGLATQPDGSYDIRALVDAYLDLAVRPNR
jgi:hypothetical protein